MKKIDLRAIAPALFAIVIDSMGFGLVYPILTAIFTYDNAIIAHTSTALRHFYLGLGFLLYPLFMFFGASFMGDFSDIIGRKKVLILCMAGIAVSFFLMGLGTSFASISLLMIGRALSGLMAGSQPIAQAAIVDLSTEKQKALNMSVITLVLSLGLVIGPVIGGVFSDQAVSSFFHFSTPFYLSAVLALIACFWIALSFRETFYKKRELSIEWLRPIQVFVEAFYDRSIRAIALVFLLMQMGFSIYFQLILVLLDRKYGYTSWKLGIFNAFIGFSFGVGMLLIIRAALRFWKIEKISYVFLFLTAAMQILSSMVDSIILIWVLAFFVAAFDMVAYSAMLTNFSNAAIREKQGWAMGISGAVMAVSWALTGFTTNLISYVGIDGLIFWGGVLILISSILMFAIALQRK